MIFRYNVKYYDMDDSSTKEEGGITIGENHGEAANRVVDYYSEEQIFSLNIYACYDVLTDDDLENFQKRK